MSPRPLLLLLTTLLLGCPDTEPKDTAEVACNDAANCE